MAVSFLGIMMVLGLAFGLALSWRRGAERRATADGPVCGGCGYSVRGLATFICPECGRDLREAGILAPDMIVGSGLGAVVRGGLWSAAVCVVAVIVSAVVFDKLLPVVTTGQQIYTLLGPRSNRYRQVDFHSHGYHLRWPWQQPSRSLIIDTVDLTLTPTQGSPITLAATIDELGYAYQRTDGTIAQKAWGLDTDVILDWMSTTGMDTSGGAVKAEADVVARTAKEAAGGSMGAQLVGAGAPFGGSTGRGAKMYSAPLAVAYPAAFMFWLMVWGVGLRWAMKGRNAPHLQRRPPSPVAPPR